MSAKTAADPAKKQSLPMQIPETVLGELARKWVTLKEDVDHLKGQLKDAEIDLINEMKKQKRLSIVLDEIKLQLQYKPEKNSIKVSH